MITTGGSGFTAELGCSLPGATSTCNPAGTLPVGGNDSKNLTTFIEELSKVEFDYWSPQIYAKDMSVKWAGWEKDYYDLWSFPHEKIIPSVPQKVNVDTVASMQSTLKGWLTESDLFPELSETLPFVGYPY